MSLIVHALIGVALYFRGAIAARPASPTAMAHEETVLAASMRDTRAQASRERLEHVEKIVQVLERSLDQTPSILPAMPEDLTKRTQLLEESITALDRLAKAKQLAELLKIPEVQALKQVPPPRKATVAKRALDDGELAVKAAELETKAIAAAAFRHAQQGRAGVSITRSRADGERDGIALAYTQLAEFSRHQVIPDKRAVLSTGWLSNKETSVPAIVQPSSARGTGQVIGTKGLYADRILISGWHIIGPFAGGPPRALDVAYPPEIAVNLDAAYPGKGGRIVRWRYVSGAAYPIIPPSAEENAIYYGYAEVNMERARDLTVWVGADDDARLWLNNQQVWRSSDGTKPWYYKDFRSMKNEINQWNLSENKGLLHFRKGRNKLLFKLNNGIDAVFASIVLSK
jgi:hypothetical protein